MTTPTEHDVVDVCVLVVSYNSGRDLPGFLDALPAAAAGLALRVVIIDNGSHDDSVEVARSRGALVIDTGQNLGYAGGINVGRHWASGANMILVANPDLRFGPDSIATMYAESLTHPGSVMVPRLLDSDDRVRPSLRREPTIRRQLGEAVFGDHWPNRPGWLAIIVRDPDAYRHPRTTDWATGAALMIPAECDDRVGPWDEDFFLYSEEIDFARRARSAGFSTRFTPNASATHDEGGSGRSDRLFALDAVNRVRYFRKWHGRLHTLVYVGAILIELVMRIDRSQHRAAIAPVIRAALPVALGRPIAHGADFHGVRHMSSSDVLARMTLDTLARP